ncbi:protein kinase [Nocardioides sp. LHG3406-4]|uniref:protein kinase n=1 Tax=Nocardioides sp. LHG3406-4 TaxID=2804575 RepID=UPI003CF54107
MSAAPQVYPHSGEEIGPFRITHVLGGDAAGAVYGATPSRPGGSVHADVALRVVPPHLSGDRGFRVRFAREARAMVTLESGNLARVYTFGEDRGRLYLASQLTRDADLGTALRTRGAPPLGVALDLVCDMAAGLADLHLAGLVHRDIQPANVLLRERPDGVTAYLAGLGSSPAAEPGPLDAAWDVRTLGWLLWTTLTGLAPYAGPVRQLAGDSPQVLHVNHVLRTALAAHPALAYPSAAALRDDLRLAGSLPGPSWLVATPLARRRRGRAAAVVAAVVAALALGVGGAVWAGAAMRGDQAAAQPAAGEPARVAWSDADERRAVASIAAAFDGQLLVGPARATCIAERWVASVGVGALVEARFLDERMVFYDRDLATVDPEVKTALGEATSECLVSRTNQRP